MLFSSFKHRNYLVFSAGVAISNIGTWTHRLAQDWLVLDITGSAKSLGIVVAAQFLPGVFFGIYGGVLADKFDQRRILILCNFAGVALTLLLGLAVLLDFVTFGILVAAALALGIASAIEGPARQSYYVRLVGDVDLPNALSWNQVNLYLGRLVGPLVAGFLIQYYGMAPAFFLNSLTYLVAVYTLFVIRPNLYILEQAVRSKLNQESLYSAVSYLRSTKKVSTSILIVSLAALLGMDMQITSVLMVRSEFNGNAAVLGILSAIFAAGAILGSVMFAKKKMEMDLTFIGKRILYVSLVWLLAAFAPNYLIYAITLFLVGYFSVGVAISGNMSIRQFVDPGLYGKVWGIYISLWLTALAIGAPIIGFISELASVRVAIAGGALIAILIALSTIWTMKKRPQWIS